MKKSLLKERPYTFSVSQEHALAQGLVFAGLGQHYGTTVYSDSSLYGRNGILTNMDPNVDWIYAKGRFGLELGGVDDWVNIASYPFVVRNPYTIAIWCRIPYVEVICDNTLILQTTTWGGGDSVGMAREWVTERWKTAITLRKNGSQVIKYYIDSIDLSWHHIVGVFDTSVYRALYLDGLLVGTDEASRTSLPNRATAIGRNYENYQPAAGQILDTMLYNRILTQSEIKQLADPANVMLSGLIQSPKRKFYNITRQIGTPYKQRLIIGNGRQIVSLGV